MDRNAAFLVDWLHQGRIGLGPTEEKEDHHGARPLSRAAATSSVGPAAVLRMVALFCIGCKIAKISSKSVGRTTAETYRRMAFHWRDS